MNNEQLTNNRLQIRRVIRAPREKVYNAFLERASLEKWFHPGAMTTKVHHIEPTEGGTFRLTMISADEPPSTHTCAGTYLELRPHERIVHSFAWEDEGAATTGTDSRVIVTFEDAPEGTEVTFVHEGLSDRESTENHAEGWTGALENLATATEA